MDKSPAEVVRKEIAFRESRLVELLSQTSKYTDKEFQVLLKFEIDRLSEWRERLKEFEKV